MNRFLAALKLDMRVQVRNNLYAIGLILAALVAVLLAWLGSPRQLANIVPALLLIVVGGTTFLYVGALIMIEKEQGTLSATIVSPMLAAEYLWSKILTLTGLACLEAILMVGGGMLIMRIFEPVQMPNFIVLLAGILVLGVLYTLMGIILTVRYEAITDYLVPLALIVSVLQLPFLYFWGVFEQAVFLVLPTSAPAMLMRGAFIQLTSAQWVYAWGYSLALIAGLTWWAYRAFDRHIVSQAG